MKDDSWASFSVDTDVIFADGEKFYYTDERFNIRNTISAINFFNQRTYLQILGDYGN